MVASTSREGLYRMHWERNISSVLGKGFRQPLPNPHRLAENYMTRIMSNISETRQILSDPVVNTNELIIDSGCTDHMFNTNVQLTNYSVLPLNSKTVSVANGLLIPVLGSGSCGILKQVYYVPDLSHSLLSVRS